MSRPLELIYDYDCPSVDLARNRLREACLKAGWDPAWVEWCRSDPEAPDYVRRHGSPTVLLDGADPFDEVEGTARRCRLYRTVDGLDRAPSVQSLVSVLLSADR